MATQKNARPFTSPEKKLPPIEDPQDRLFYSPDGTDIRVTLSDGQVAIVNDPRTLPRQFHKQAAREGCMVEIVGAGDKKGASKSAKQRQRSGTASVDEPKTAGEIAADAHARRAAIKAAILEAVEADENDPDFEGAWTENETPDLNWLSDRLGFMVEAGERDLVFKEVSEELDAEDDDNDGE